ncbi:MAG: hypothetical protein IKX66_05990 [Clostridia bacterium]|nr:hypothetical protein [Clostridia bacterium]
MRPSNEAGSTGRPQNDRNERKRATFDDGLDLILDADGDGDRDLFDREEAEEEFLDPERDENDSDDFSGDDSDDL